MKLLNCHTVGNNGTFGDVFGNMYQKHWQYRFLWPHQSNSRNMSCEITRNAHKDLLCNV